MDAEIRITRPASGFANALPDEGIVQPFSKEREQLSRRLHQKCALSGEIRRARFLFVAIRFATMKRPAKQLSTASAAYIAGLIDGEGTITLTRLHTRENRRLVVSIASTELSLLQFVHEEFGAGKITRKRTQSVRHTPSFCFAVTSRQALFLLRQVKRHLHTYKQKRAELALKHYESLTPRNGKYTPELLAQRHVFEEKLLRCLPNDRSVRSTGGGYAAMKSSRGVAVVPVSSDPNP